jgi:transposase
MQMLQSVRVPLLMKEEVASVIVAKAKVGRSWRSFMAEFAGRMGEDGALLEMRLEAGQRLI